MAINNEKRNLVWAQLRHCQFGMKYKSVRHATRQQWKQSVHFSFIFLILSPYFFHHCLFVPQVSLKYCSIWKFCPIFIFMSIRIQRPMRRCYVALFNDWNATINNNIADLLMIILKLIIGGWIIIGFYVVWIVDWIV